MFRTEIDVAPTRFPLSISSKVLTIGSCFSDVMGNKLATNKVSTFVNPFGTLFNPVSVCKLLEAAAGMPYDFSDELVENQGQWYAYNLHSSVTATSEKKLLNQIRKKIQQTNAFLQQTDLLIITFGTAVAYQLNKTGNIVANCHKIPQKNFNRFILQPEQILEAFSNMQSLVTQLHPKVRILVTVSPVRHVKETLEVNSVSKSILRLVCQQLSNTYENVSYFPSYEIMLDDLRDYRFYKPDMLHPNEVAENYIWEKFKDAYFTKDLKQFIKEWDQLAKAFIHKPFNPKSEGHQKFLRNTISKLEQLQSIADFSEEIQVLQKQLV